jgi:hypothetical protein
MCHPLTIVNGIKSYRGWGSLCQPLTIVNGIKSYIIVVNVVENSGLNSSILVVVIEGLYYSSKCCRE